MKNWFARFIFLIFGIFLFTLCSGFIPVQDCGTVPNVHVRGVVVDYNDHPIENATIRIRSERSTCPNAVAIEPIVIQTESDGSFDYTIEWISEGDIMKVSVTSKGYRGISRIGTYPIFDEDFDVMLFPID